jgi:hypothetical protein
VMPLRFWMDPLLCCCRIKIQASNEAVTKATQAGKLSRSNKAVKAGAVTAFRSEIVLNFGKEGARVFVAIFVARHFHFTFIGADDPSFLKNKAIW